MAPDLQRSIGDLVQLVRGTTYKGSLVGKPGPALLGLGSIVPGGGFRAGEFKTYGGECPRKLMLFPGDLYVSLKGATKDGEMVGSIARVPPQVPSGRLTQDTVKLVLGTETEDLRSYLYWLLRTPQYRAYCAGRATGSAVVALSRDDFLSYPVPPLTAERGLIAEVLDHIEGKESLNRQMNETLEAISQAVFRDWFVDFGPTRRKTEGATDPLIIMGGLVSGPDEAEHLANLFPDSFGPDELPEGWKERPIGELAKIVGGATPSTTERSYWNDSGHRWATPKDLSKRDGLFLFDTDRKLTDSGLGRVGSGLSPRGTVLLSSRAPIGYLAIAGTPTAVNQGFIAIRPTPELPTAMALFWCRENMALIKSKSNGSTFQEISKKNFKPLPVVVPGPEITQSFVDLVNPFLELISARIQESFTLSATRDLLLSKLMSGEIRLREAEERLQEVA